MERDVVHFFGILSPGKQSRRKAAEAPAKTNFFCGLPDIAFGSVPMSRLEQDACYLNGKAPQPELRDDVREDQNQK